MKLIEKIIKKKLAKKNNKKNWDKIYRKKKVRRMKFKKQIKMIIDNINSN
jgi:hypothetical protein